MAFCKAYARTLGSLAVKAPSLKIWALEQVGGGHGDDHTGLFQSCFEIFLNRFGFGGSGIQRDQIVVVEVDTVSAYFTQQTDEVSRGFGTANGGR